MITDGAVINPEAVRAFAARLNQFANETRDHLASLLSTLRDIGDSDWQDAQYAKFESEFEPLATEVLRCLVTMETEFVTDLRRHAELAEEYLKRR